MSCFDYSNDFFDFNDFNDFYDFNGFNYLTNFLIL
jgi:hypothetical protein